jgi:integrase
MSKRKRGRGTIYQQPGCKSWTIQYYRGGRRVREAVGSGDYRAAEQRLTQRLAQCDRGEAIDIARKSAMVSELWSGLERHYRINGRKSAECLGRRWKHLGAFFANMPACNVSYDRLEEYVDLRLSEHVQNATINRELSALKTAFRLGRKKQTVRLVPDFPHLAENNTRTGFLEDQEYATLTARCSELWLRLFLEIAYSLAWRKSEILNLQVRNISMSARTIRLDVGSTKNGEGREVAMTQRIAALVEQAIAGKSAEDYLLTRGNGQRVKDFRKAWRNLTSAAGLSDKLIHDLRRSGARQLRRAGVPESVVQSIGGWKTAAMFRRYAIVNNADQKAAMEKLEKAREAAANSHDFSHDFPETNGAAVIVESGKVQ